jgi:hypothetical protein
MTHHDDRMFPAPAHVFLVPGAGGAPETVDRVRLIIEGQGTVVVPASRRPGDEVFVVTIGDPDVGASPALRWEIRSGTVTLAARIDGTWTAQTVVEREAVGLDADPDCRYWFSIDSLKLRLRYGKGEMRLETCLASYELPHPSTSEPASWLTKVDFVHFDPPVAEATGGSRLPARIDIWRDPVVVNAPLKILPDNQITMLDMAQGTATVVANLTVECQTLYANIAGERFGLDAPDFREFSQAIQLSIDSPDGWCNKQLIRKAGEFGERDIYKTYLRITMGANQGESPGIPFVMEIWPHEHYSPIHNHGGANAMIRVLHGEICVSLYAMLSDDHKTPFAQMSFVKDDVTWITPRLNQIHMLKNEKPDACITIQCYMYPETDQTHYPYFDYIGKAGVISQFLPDSDMDFLQFRETMRKEWEARPLLLEGVVAGSYVAPDSAAGIDVPSEEELINLAAHRGLAAAD